MGQRYFDLEQAEKLLPQLTQWIQTVISNNGAIQSIVQERAQFADRVTNHGGLLVDISYWLRRKEEQEALTSELESAGEAIEQSGCLVKDIVMGLIDFPCELEGQEFYLCWKLGEPSISFWHGVHEGFAGRKPIDAEMIARLHGSRPV